ncbi:hypothetical protein THIOSC15_1420010 [uncultured Thiomicrorhabdus sp.]
MTLNKLKKHQDKIPYEMLSKETLQSLRNPNALAIWVYLSSKPDELNVLKGHLQSHFSLSDVDYKKAIDELKQLGLFSIETVLNEENGEVTNQINVYPFITNKMEKSSVPGVHSHVIEKLVTNVQNSEEKTFIKSSQKTHPKPKEVAAFILETRLQANATNAKHFANEFIRFADAVGWSNDWRSQVNNLFLKQLSESVNHRRIYNQQMNLMHSLSHI